MKTGTKWGIGLGVGIPGVLILIGLIGLLIKFFMKRCRKKAWYNISSEPKQSGSIVNDTDQRKLPKRTSSDRLPLYQSGTNNAMNVSASHISIPMDENDVPPGQYKPEKSKEHEHTLVQIQRDRLNRLKEEENRLRPMIRLTNDANDIQHVIDQAQKEFEESV